MKMDLGLKRKIENYDTSRGKKSGEKSLGF